VENYQVKIPAGVREGQQLRLAGRGEGGAGRGPAGDLFLRVRFAKHPDYRVEGDDLYHDIELAPWEAVLGAKVSVPTLGGRVSIKIPAGAQGGQKLRVRGHGLPRRGGGRGDLYVVLYVQVPQRVSESERALWERLARESRFSPRD
jgi:curved DNA-binding protein